MKIHLSIDYKTAWGQELYVYGSTKELGEWDENRALPLSCLYSSRWGISFNTTNNDVIEYAFIVKESGKIIRKEWGIHSISISEKKDYSIINLWQNKPLENHILTSAFSDSFFFHSKEKAKPIDPKSTRQFKVNCYYADRNQVLAICGEGILGDWNPKNAPLLTCTNYGVWEITLDTSSITTPLQYKFILLDKATKEIIFWESGENRVLDLNLSESIQIEELSFRRNYDKWKAAGTAIPVFSLRSENSFGVGEFSDLKKMIDWTALTGQKIIQVLPINDSTITGRWTDSYPYNAISIYALHPIYLGLHEYPLADKKLHNQFLKEAANLNKLPNLDYEQVFELKGKYVSQLFEEIGVKTLKSRKFKDFYSTNKEWLFPYACFSYLRDKYKTADYSQWNEYAIFDKNQLQALANNRDAELNINKTYFIQFLLHTQLLEAKEYAHKKGVVLKGDIPIGISKNSVEAWIEPHLFNLDTQTGAPPDDFSVHGQNWGFPTYNWDEMAKDGYQWWIKRFKKMADYFDVYRIDHILGFFRIWEIPLNSVQGLLGYFRPALPFSVEEIESGGLTFDEKRMTQPYIQEELLANLFGEQTDIVINTYLDKKKDGNFELKDICNTQKKIQALFENDTNNTSFKDGLYALCNEVLFVKDKKEPHKFHPRILAQQTHSFKSLSQVNQNAFNKLYDDFFYHRHSEFWRQEAMKKLPTLISSTSMLVCGEDLGMIPNCVPSVMRDLQILSLEIQRMPKASNVLFENLETIPYHSVCTTSTHDMSPIRLWWKEDKEITQHFYNEVLAKEGIAPDECTPELCELILEQHLNSPAMLVILPLQDWLAMDDKLRRENPEDERINIPAVSQHYWRYRMHISLENLIKETSFNKKIEEKLKKSRNSMQRNE